LSRGWLIFPLLILYLLDLGSTGFLNPDEPRYASIGREMARSHDFVTPRLNGQPWFEKPPLLYWSTAAGHMLRLPDEVSARLPVALMSLAFLYFFFGVLMREFSARTALAATAILSTSAGWLAYSFAAVPDLPMTAALAAAMLIALFDTRLDTRHGNRGGALHERRINPGYAAGALLGVAILAKGFVPLVLFAPLFLIARRKRLAMIAGCLVVAAPWYLLCWARNGSLFWHEFFWKQQVLRYFTPLLEHVQPWWFYIPVILAALFPWTPLSGLLLLRKTYDDVRVRSLALWLVYALLFFSVSRNKLPGYVLPLMPPLAIALAVGLEKSGTALKWWLAASALMLVALPVIAAVLPNALLFGIRHTPGGISYGIPASLLFRVLLATLILATCVWWLAWRGKPNLAVAAVALGIVFAVTWLKGPTFLQLDQRVSARAFWRARAPEIQNACIGDEVRRDWQYELNYYAGRALPLCDPNPMAPGRPVLRVTNRDGALLIVRQ
jgi:4-amino-4-deoxy-L-arabinose transferase-like glycosyltransferase